MNIAIIEDELPALNRLQKMIREIDPLINIAGTADSIESACKLFRSETRFDLALLDIELADGQSFELFSRTNVYCPVIFTTAYDDYALRAFKLNSIDYLLKPIDKNELENAILKFKTFNSDRQSYQEQMIRLLDQIKIPQPGYKTRFLVKTGTKLHSISCDEIAYFHAVGKGVWLHTRDQRKYALDQSLEELGKQVDPGIFFQLNRQFLTHIQSIRQIHTYFNGKLKIDLIPEMNEEVLVSRERATAFKQWLDK